jgi:hypothetical protein
MSSLTTKHVLKIILLRRAKPKGQKDVEVGRSLVGKAACPIYQRTPPLVQGGTPHSTRISMVRITGRSNRCMRPATGKCQNASGEESPDGCMQKFDRGKHRNQASERSRRSSIMRSSSGVEWGARLCSLTYIVCLCKLGRFPGYLEVSCFKLPSVARRFIRCVTRSYFR